MKLEVRSISNKDGELMIDRVAALYIKGYAESPWNETFESSQVQKNIGFAAEAPNYRIYGAFDSDLVNGNKLIGFAIGRITPVRIFPDELADEMKMISKTELHPLQIDSVRQKSLAICQDQGSDPLVGIIQDLVVQPSYRGTKTAGKLVETTVREMLNRRANMLVAYTHSRVRPVVRLCRETFAAEELIRVEEKCVFGTTIENARLGLGKLSALIGNDK